MGLLITPSGIRLPFGKPYHTREYCKAKGLVHHPQPFNVVANCGHQSNAPARRQLNTTSPSSLAILKARPELSVGFPHPGHVTVVIGWSDHRTQCLGYLKRGRQAGTIDVRHAIGAGSFLTWDEGGSLTRGFK